MGAVVSWEYMDGSCGESDFGAFVDALIETGARLERKVAKPLRDEKVQEWLERAHREAQERRYAA
jgi:hypothetical protein